MKKILINREQILTSSLFIILIFITLIAYWPGVSGDFIFDDLPNLQTLHKYPELSTWKNFLLFSLEGIAGPTGRPVSLASFYLNDIAWPSQPRGFIITNILLHLLNGILVFWLVIKLGVSLKLDQQKKVTLALLTTTFWLLHPFNTTSVLYIIQRMTELSALFILSGLIFYLYGRQKLARNTATGFVILFIGTGLSLVLAVLSKENGILLVSYILAIEFFLLRPSGNTPPRLFNYWFFPAVIIPFIVIMGYILYYASQPELYNFRNFTLSERLLTECRILFNYIHHILLPSIGSSGLFQDDYIISKNFLTPWTTLPAVLGILGLLLIAFFTRKKMPIISFSIAWFFAGHLLESTAIPLELYYEHRNYLPMLGFLFAIGYYVSQWLQTRFLTASLLTGMFIAFLVFSTSEKASLWGKPVELLAVWEQAHPDSIRAKGATMFLKNQIGSNSTEALSQGIDELSTSSSTSAFWRLQYNCGRKKITPDMLNDTLAIMEKKTVTPSAVSGMQKWLKDWDSGRCPTVSQSQIEFFLLKSIPIGKASNNTKFIYLCHSWLAKIYKDQKNLGKTMLHLEKAYAIHPSVKLLTSQAFILSSAGLYQQAIDKLANTRELKSSLRKYLVYQLTKEEIEHLKQRILRQMDTQKKLAKD